MPQHPSSDFTTHRVRSRSRSPALEAPGRHRDRPARSPRRDDNRRKRHKYREKSPASRPVSLPYKAQQLSKRQYEEYKPLFQSYLDIQKQINLEELDEKELKGRWKSFVGHWNRGDLARSWYDPVMLKSAQETAQYLQEENPNRHQRASPKYESRNNVEPDSDEDDFGPAPPPGGMSRHSGHGPTIPKLDDIAYRNDLRQEDRDREQSNYADDIRYERKADRKAQKERLDDLVPRADPGSRERQLEKKRETTSTLKEFRDAKEGGDVEMEESELMGDDGIEGYKKKKKVEERQKNERELRREEILRAKTAEREEKAAERRAKEAQTMDYLRSIARERFGSGQ